MLLYRQTQPTTALVLAGDTHTLTFTCPDDIATPSSSIAPQIQLSFNPIAQFDPLGSSYVGPVYGALGLVQLRGETFLCVVESAQPVTSKNWPDERVSRILAVGFYSVSSTTWDGHPGPAGDSSGTSTPVGGGPRPSSRDSFGLDPPHQNIVSGPGGPAHQLEHPAYAVEKILSNGYFYFSSGKYDVSTRMEERIRRRDEGDDTAYDPRFVWNSFLMDSILDFRANLSAEERETFSDSGFLVSVIQGYVGTSDFTLSGNPVTLSIISRLGFGRAGTRFNTRGIDDDGHVANFVETETIFRTKDSTFSFVQVRGSVPLFWEQQGTTPFGGQKVQITRPPIASQPAFNKHFAALLAAYPHIQVVNLLSSKDHESQLSQAFSEHIRNLNAQLGEKDDEKAGAPGEVGYALFDFHREARSAGGIESVKELMRREPLMGGAIENFGYCLVAQDEKAGETLLHKQEGVFRTNCLDTLDRTNVAQDVLSSLALDQYLRNLVPIWASSDILLSAHRTLWAENGDALSNIYAGTGALNTSFTRSGKRTLAGALSDAKKSVGRMYISNFLDKGKQLAIDALLGNLAGQQKVVVVDPVRDTVDTALKHRESEYSSTKSYTVFIGTFNVNGKVPGDESLVPWLFPTPGVEPDIIALGFQELVELSPQQIMATDPAKLKQWQTYIIQAVAKRPKAQAEYVLLRSDQLVGTCQIVLTKTSVIQHIRNVEAATKKTGLKGMAGNKGAVAVRLDLNDSSFCLITAHFAAGHSNFEQRNLDYATISEGLRFRRGRKIAAHDNIIYFGDLNYRIALPNDEVRHLAHLGDHAGLVEGDQLTMCLNKQAVFAGYSEGPLLFAPTYKYDNGTDTYDTSEKQRIPSWTDRVLYKGERLDLVKYGRAEVMMSDHRPVYALFRVNVRVINQSKKATLTKELFATLAPAKEAPPQPSRALVDLAMDDDEDLPPPSTASRTWWSDLDLAIAARAVTRVQSSNISTNPFDVGSPASASASAAASNSSRNISSPSSSRTPSEVGVKRKPVPPLPSNKPTLPFPTKSNSIGSLSSSELSVGLAPQATLSRKASSSSLLDEDDDKAADMPERPRNQREATTEWQMIQPRTLS